MTNELYLIKKTISDIVNIALLEKDKIDAPKSDDLTQRQAYEKFGEAWVKKCVRRNLVKKHRKGTAKNSPVYYSKVELMKVRAAETAARNGAFDGTNL